jgi:hypothetical protein
MIRISTFLLELEHDPEWFRKTKAFLPLKHIESRRNEKGPGEPGPRCCAYLDRYHQ